MKTATMRRVYLREAAILLILSRLAVRIVPPARIFAWAKQPLPRIRRFGVDEIRWTAWAVEAAGARRWMNASCLARALAACLMLRRRGIASRLCLGVARENGALNAHAWLEVDEYKVTGGAEAAAFTRLAAFGGIAAQG